MNVTPARFSDKTAEERKLYFVDWTNGVADAETFQNVEWLSEPPGLGFSDPTTTGKKTQVMIESGVRGQSYRVRCRVTLTSTGEVLEASVNDDPGIPLQILGSKGVETVPAYRWT